MNKITKLFLIIFSLFYASNSQAKLNIFACESEWAALAKEITQDKSDIFIAVHPKQDAHHISAKPSLIAKARKADLLICNGGDLEAGWLPIIIKNSRNNNIITGAPGNFMATDYVELIEKPNKIDRKFGDIHIYGNPHIHFSPDNILIVAKELLKKITSLDPKNKEYYNDNYNNFRALFSKKIQSWRKIKIKNEIIVIHRSYSYLLKWLAVENYYNIEKYSGVSPSLKHLKYLRDKFTSDKEFTALISDFDDKSLKKWLSEFKNINVLNIKYSPDFNEDIISFFDKIFKQISESQNL